MVKHFIKQCDLVTSVSLVTRICCLLKCLVLVWLIRDTLCSFFDLAYPFPMKAELSFAKPLESNLPIIQVSTALDWEKQNNSCDKDYRYLGKEDIFCDISKFICGFFSLQVCSHKGCCYCHNMYIFWIF